LIPRMSEEKWQDVKEETDVWCFVHGSMMNPTSIRLRDINPKASYWARVEGYERCFRGGAGMSTMQPLEGSEIHGVAHVLTREDMDKLSAIERTYDVIEFDSHLVLPQERIRALGFSFKTNVNETSQPGVPSERYMDIILEGAKAVHFSEEQLAVLKAIPFRPRSPNPCKFNLLNLEASTRTFTKGQVVQESEAAVARGEEPWIICSNQVLQHQPDSSKFGKEMHQQWAGKDCTHFIVKVLYEPRNPPAWKEEDMTQDHLLFAEDFISSMFPELRKLGNVVD